MLTAPETFETDFQIIDVVRPQGLLGKFVSALPLNLTPLSPPELYQDAHALAEYKISIDRAVRALWSNAEASRYYELLHSVDPNKTTLTTDEYEIVMQCVDCLLNNVYTSPYFKNDKEELLFQVGILFEYRGFECKALLDGVRINHETKQIRPFDLKSTGQSVYSFGNSFLNYGYFRQAAFYYHAIQTEGSPVKKYLDEGYTLLPFQFIVVETRRNTTAPALIYEVSEEDLAAGFSGGIVNGRSLKGIDQLLDDYTWHLENDLWEFPRDVYEQQGVYNLHVFQNG